ncbi:MAG: hypothetical protein KAS23_04275, partial [Anaerohalosphaera sp.]|nr:hypothetical protein [Anaerohalosphaera sp.]
SSGQLPFGYYHVGPWLLAVGVIGFIRQHRPAAIALAITGMVLAFCKPVLQVSPVVWTLMPLLFGAILISQAIQWIPGLLERKGKPYMMAMVVVLYIAVFYDAILSAGRIVDYIF